MNEAFEQVIEEIFSHHMSRVKALEAESKSIENTDFTLQGESVNINADQANEPKPKEACC